MDAHYFGLIAGYAAATAVLWALWFVARPLVAAPGPLRFERPWLEVGLVILAVLATIAVGQAYLRDMLLTDEGPVLQSANQALIFAPILIAVALRPHRIAGGGLPLGMSTVGLPIGLVLAAGALAIYALTRGEDIGALFHSVVRIDNAPHAAQVLFEDIAIAALLLRLNSALGARWAVVLVAGLFAAAHIPAMLTGGAELIELGTLVLDTLLGVMVMGAIIATRSIWWLWPVHLAMDLTQFYEA